MKLDTWMKLRGLKDGEVAEMLGKAGHSASRPTVSRIRRGVQRPGWGLVLALAAISDGAVTANDFAAAPTGSAAE